jgi:hypothetical protein
LGEGAVEAEQQLLSDDFDYALRVLQNLVVPEADDPIAETFDDFRSRFVAPRSVLATVKLHDEMGLAGCKVGDAGADRELPDELDAFELARAQPLPEAPFRFGALLPEAPCYRRQSLNHPSAPHPDPLPAGERGIVRHLNNQSHESLPVNA